MSCYHRLESYFPHEELKSKEQLQDLLQNQVIYKKFETEDALLLYGDFPSFLFVDYLLIDSRVRGKGIGGQVIEKLKQHEKPILLEVEPAQPDHPDTLSRIHFYKKHGFIPSEKVEYLYTGKNGKTVSLEIYYWSPRTLTPTQIWTYMAEVCEKIHGFHSLKHYGRHIRPENVLKLKSPVDR
ncbi:GNAT family N-acetyltransferase [Kroppenstedtia pulmonis]|uniref:GNAT family N-acetyltransferase n=1 Tax=Kroppenstedtia pulmonis TaxID=1380685 RepID=A0A7D4CL61_9BACL|nr:GNAT family N-acetyltransferase [Kroppenstedtia pulmonis]QKG83858.1 GNAT family N-acetyltransferase [Kroppenstedtia pulmonis]